MKKYTDLYNKIIESVSDEIIDKLLSSKNIYYYRIIKVPTEERKAEVQRTLKYRCFKSVRLGTTQFLKLIGKTIAEFMNYPTITPTEYNIYGCPLSTDIDIAIRVPKQHYIQYIMEDTVQIDLSIILEQLGQVNADKLDINYLFVENGVATAYTRGGPEINNMIYYTYHHHRQNHLCFIEEPIKLNISDRIRSITKFIMDNLETLVGKQVYRDLRDMKKDCYNDFTRRMRFTHHILTKIDFGKVSPDLIKSLTIKFAQLYMEDRGEYAYTKADISRRFRQRSEQIMGMLTRKSFSPDVMNWLMENFIIISDKHYISHIDEYIGVLELPPINTTLISDQLFNSFYNNPLQPSTNFGTKLAEYSAYMFGASEYPLIEPFFKIPTFGIEYLPEDIRAKVYNVEQRSDEWHRLRAEYDCVRDVYHPQFKGESLDEYIKFNYPLIRGCIVESIIISEYDFRGIFGNQVVRKVSVGMIDDVSPDLLLVVGDERQIVPVEIKCVPTGPSDNGNFRRAFKLAREQIKKTCKIVSSDQGLVVVVFVDEGRFLGRVYRV